MDDWGTMANLASSESSRPRKDPASKNKKDNGQHHLLAFTSMDTRMDTPIPHIHECTYMGAGGGMKRCGEDPKGDRGRID